MNTKLFNDPFHGTSVVFNGSDTVTVTVATTPFGKLTMPLSLDDVDRLLALREHAAYAWLDLAEFFEDEFHAPTVSARRAATAFMVAAPGLAETLR